MNCDLRCQHCYADAGPPVIDELDTSEVINILETLWRMGVNEIIFTGGDAPCRGDLFEILDFCKNKFKIGLLTNGWRITEEFAEKLSKYNPRIEISLDGANAETHDKIRGMHGSFEKAISAIRCLSTRNVYVMVAMMITPFNIGQIESTLEVSQLCGASLFRMGKVIPAGRAKCIGWELSKDQMNIVAKSMEELSEKYKGKIGIDQWDTVLKEDESEGTKKNCGAGYKHIAISPNGKVRACLIMNEERLWFGDIRKENFKDIMAVKNPKLKMFYKMCAPSKNDCNGCELDHVCVGCVDIGCLMSKSNPDCKWAKKYVTI
jgi:radical SAM protein with 4Fe4S-binding SPASM domain